MTVRTHAQDCPKCGWTLADGGGPWRGPFYCKSFEGVAVADGLGEEVLRFTCPGCGFAVDMPCADVSEAKP